MNAPRVEGNLKMQQAVRHLPNLVIVKMQHMMQVLLEIISVFPAPRASCAHLPGSAVLADAVFR
jgi:hypothetical protein